jgi:exosome complex component MTR3
MSFAGSVSAPYVCYIFSRTHLRFLRLSEAICGCISRIATHSKLRLLTHGIVLQTSIIPSASGSAYLEIPSSSPAASSTLIPPTSSLKITASIQGPKPLPRSAPFSPSLLLTTTVKFAPFATRHRRGYIRDSAERDLGVHLETALRGVIIGERWPKSGVEVVVTILEGDEDGWWGDSASEGSATGSGWGLLNVLAGCITVASAAITDAGIDCVDVVCGGVAAITRNRESRQEKELVRVLDPCPAEHKEVVAACVVGYLASRDEITEIWMKGDVGSDPDGLIEGATYAAVGSLAVVKEVLLEALQAKFQGQIEGNEGGLKRKAQDVEMTG